MQAAPFDEYIQARMARYKREVLGVVADGTWSYRGRTISYAHILPAELYRLNVIDSVRDEFWAYWSRQGREAPRPARLHRFFAHLTSSQALAFNLFFPFLGSSRARPSLLLEALVLPAAEAAESVRDWRFEAVPDAT